MTINEMYRNAYNKICNDNRLDFTEKKEYIKKLNRIYELLKDRYKRKERI